ncbi:hypothetical protein J5681_07675 [bacterium]|nr:hypothetical protein [bacterium]
MKKFLAASLLIFAMCLIASCVSEDEETDETNNQSDTSADTGNVDTESQTDTGSETDTGSSDTTSDTDSSDTTDSSTDTTDTGSENPGQTTPDSCIGFSIDSKIKFYSGIYVTKITDNLLGDHSLQDQLIISFPEKIAEAGTYDLTSTSNKNYSTCTECVLVLEDVNTSGQVTREYFQTSGTLTIEEVDDSYGINGTVSATLVEVTIADEDGGYLSTPVTNGKCVEIEGGNFEGICVPNCKAEDGTDKICGDDGCGHECGEGCGTDLACSADQKECVPYECEKVTINPFERVKMTVPSYYEFQSTLTPNIGESATDLLSFQIYYGEKMNKVWDLAGTNLNNCQLCLLVAEDQGKRFYFQQKGTIDFSREPDKDSNFFNPTEGTMNNIAVQGLRLIESKIDTFDNIATPVPGGKCLEITNTVFNYTN